MMNNGKYYTEEYKRKQTEKLDRLYGPVLSHNKLCSCCGNEFVFEGRLNTKLFERSLFCSRACANNRQEWWDDNATRYRTIAFKYWTHKCVICEFDKIVAIHHIDENKTNNAPRNLIPLCPNHHEMVHHSKWKNDVVPLIEKAVEEKFGGLV